MTEELQRAGGIERLSLPDLGNGCTDLVPERGYVSFLEPLDLARRRATCKTQVHLNGLTMVAVCTRTGLGLRTRRLRIRDCAIWHNIGSAEGTQPRLELSIRWVASAVAPFIPMRANAVLPWEPSCRLRAAHRSGSPNCSRSPGVSSRVTQHCLAYSIRSSVDCHALRTIGGLK